jgi:hypothetical protein
MDAEAEGSKMFAGEVHGECYELIFRDTSRHVAFTAITGKSKHGEIHHLRLAAVDLKTKLTRSRDYGFGDDDIEKDMDEALKLVSVILQGIAPEIAPKS